MTTRIIQGQVVVLDYVMSISKLNTVLLFGYESAFASVLGGPRLIPDKKGTHCEFIIYGIDKSEHKIRYYCDDIDGISIPINSYISKMAECVQANMESMEIAEAVKPHKVEIENHITEFGNSKIKEIREILNHINPIKTL